ncbi:MAG: threonine--tRNA ligase, partial [Chloroflexi bacterium]|nr:threonine--tRNA ligase [Chloroflexota bacterium]
DKSGDRMNAKIRAAQLAKVPYMLVVGDREASSGQVSVRLRTNEDLGAMSVEAFLQRATALIASRDNHTL